jgi:hypothetical protein
MDQHIETLHTDLHTPGLQHRPHSDGTPRDEGYMETARQVIKGGHALYTTMRNAGKWVNFHSLFGDADFWAVTRDHHPDVFTAATNHIAALPEKLETGPGMYVNSTAINPVGLIQHYFPDAHKEVTIARPDFVTDVAADQVLSVERRQ